MIYQILQDAEINPANYQVEVQGSSGFGGIFSIILSFLPLILFGGILIADQGSWRYNDCKKYDNNPNDMSDWSFLDFS